MIEIIMFTKNDCPNCKRAEMLFQFCPIEIKLHKFNITPLENGQSRIDSNGDSYSSYEVQELLKTNNIMSVPSFNINGKWIEGFNEGKIKEELGL